MDGEPIVPTAEEATAKWLSPRERAVLRRRYPPDGSEPMTLEAIGERYGYSRQRALQLQQSGLAKVAKSRTPEGLAELEHRDIRDIVPTEDELRAAYLSEKERAVLLMKFPPPGTRKLKIAAIATALKMSYASTHDAAQSGLDKVRRARDPELSKELEICTEPKALELAEVQRAQQLATPEGRLDLLGQLYDLCVAAEDAKAAISVVEAARKESATREKSPGAAHAPAVVVNIGESLNQRLAMEFGRQPQIPGIPRISVPDLIRDNKIDRFERAESELERSPVDVVASEDRR